MKKILIAVAVLALVLVLSDLANKAPTGPAPGTAFSLKGVHVVACTPTEIILVDNHDAATKLVTDESWPDCSTFEANQVLDFYLSRGEKTHFISDEETSWWRRTM